MFTKRLLLDSTNRSSITLPSTNIDASCMSVDVISLIELE